MDSFHANEGAVVFDVNGCYICRDLLICICTEAEEQTMDGTLRRLPLSQRSTLKVEQLNGSVYRHKLNERSQESNRCL